MARLNNFSASGVQADAKHPRRFYDSDGEPIEPSETNEVRQAAKRCIAILQKAKGWMSGAELRRTAELSDYAIRNWDAVLGLIGNHVEINDYTPLSRYRYCEARLLDHKRWNDGQILNPEGKKPEWSLR